MIKTEISGTDSRWFAYAPADYMVRSIRAGNTKADVYVDDTRNPTVCMVHEQYTVFVDGQGTPQARRRAAEALRCEILSSPVRARLGGVKIFFGQDDGWRDCLFASFAGENAALYPRRVYRHDAARAAEHPADGILPVTEALLRDDALANKALLVDEIVEMWGSAEAFVNKGFGVCAVREGAVAGFCTAEYVSEGCCGIGIATADAYRRRGIALAMTGAFLAECAARSVTPYWECWATNEGSVRTAERAGFTRVSDYAVLAVAF